MKQLSKVLFVALLGAGVGWLLYKQSKKEKREEEVENSGEY